MSTWRAGGTRSGEQPAGQTPIHLQRQGTVLFHDPVGNVANE